MNTNTIRLPIPNALEASLTWTSQLKFEAKLVTSNHAELHVEGEVYPSNRDLDYYDLTWTGERSALTWVWDPQSLIELQAFLKAINKPTLPTFGYLAELELIASGLSKGDLHSFDAADRIRALVAAQKEPAS